MARRDKIYEIVKIALEKDDWKVKKKPLAVKIPGEDKELEVDMEAEKVMVAKKGSKQIAVEIKSFAEPSIIHTFHKVLGQYVNYKDLIAANKQPHELFVAIPDFAFDEIEKSPFMLGQMKKYGMKAFVVNLEEKVIEKWIK
ncbi:MAG: element excision factor XisH family protein [Bacteroidota bacterium]